MLPVRCSALSLHQNGQVISGQILILQRDFQVLRDLRPFGLRALLVLLERALAMRSIGGMIAVLTIVQGSHEIGTVGQALFDSVGHELTGLGHGQGGRFFCA